MKIVITGARGQLGTELVEQAIQAGFEVHAYSSQELDITQDLNLDLTEIDALINCAGYTFVDKAEEEPEKSFVVNAIGVENLAKLCKKYDTPLIHLSTDYIFDGTKHSAYVETDAPNPQNVYGASKLKGEQSLQALWDKHIILRVSWIFGRFGGNFVKTIGQLSKRQAHLKIITDQIGSPTGSSHIAEVILTLLQHPKLQSNWGTYHYTDSPLTNWYDFAKSFVDPAQCEVMPIRTAEYASKTKRPQNSALNCEKIKQIFGIQQRPWQTELRLMGIV